MDNTKYIYRGKVKHCCRYCGRPVRYSEYEEFESDYKEVSVDEKGYASKMDDVCGDCSVRSQKRRARSAKR